MFEKNVAVTGFTIGLVSATDGSDITTGTPVGYYTLDGGTQTAIADVTPVHEGNGQWSFDLTAAEMNGDIVGLVFTHASAITVHFTIRTDTLVPAIKAETDKLVFTVANQLDVNVQYWDDTVVSTALETAADVADAVLDEDMTAHQAQGSLGQAIGDPVADTKTLYGAVVTDAVAASIALDVATAQADLDIITDTDGVVLGDAGVDKVWDEDVDTSHQGAGTAGKKLDDAGAAADPWATALPGAYGAGTAGYRIGNMKDFDPATDTVALVTDLTNLPAIPTNWLTAAGINAGALDGKGNWNIGKSGYALTTQNWNVGKTGYSISGVITTLDGLNDFDPAADDVAVVTDLMNLPALPPNWLTAVSINPAALNGKGDWNTVVPLSAAAVNAEVDSALSDIFLDRLFAVNYDPASKPGVATALLNELVENDGGVSRFTSNALEQVFAVILSELTSIPAATPTVGQALMLPFMAVRNKRDTTAASDEIHNSAGGVIGTAALSDDSTTFEKGKYA